MTSRSRQRLSSRTTTAAPLGSRHPSHSRPVFTSLIPDPDDRSFKADVSFRGMLLDGLEVPFKVPYDLGIWDEDPAVYIMDPHETLAEKILGWCAHRQVKHYADLAYIALVSRPGDRQLIEVNYARARDVLDGKLEAMRRLQPNTYAAFPNIDALIDDLAQKPAAQPDAVGQDHVPARPARPIHPRPPHRRGSGRTCPRATRSMMHPPTTALR